MPFPSFATWPVTLNTFGYSSWGYAFSRGGIEPGSPRVLFDAGSAYVLSPASDFIVSRVTDSGQALSSEIDPAIANLPAGFEHRTLLAAGNGVNDALDAWGHALTCLYGKVRPSADADVSLAVAGLWTDNRSPYYYNPGVAGATMIDALRSYSRAGAPLGYLQADSWWYPKGLPPSWKNNGTGLYRLRADLDLFPDDLAGFRRRAGVPLVVHARYWHESSPDRMEYEFSGNVPVDPRYWRDVAAYLAQSGVAVYEQDWLSGPAETEKNLTAPDAFFDNMAAAMAEHGIHMQYCMPRPHHYLQGAKYGNLTSIRVSADGLARDRWDSLLFNSRLASALGIWPFADNFRSTELRSVLLAVLTAGPFGPADEADRIDAGNLRRAIRPDGVIVKPDTPLAPLDATYRAMAADSNAPMVAATVTGAGAVRAAYVFAYSRGGSHDAAFTPESLGISPAVHPRSFVYDFFAGSGEFVDTTAVIHRAVDDSGSYFVVAPVGPSGIAFLGDTSMFASLGLKRISRMHERDGIAATVEFAPGEQSAALTLYSPSFPAVASDEGEVRVSALGDGAYRVEVSSGGWRSVRVRIGPRGSSRPRYRPLDSRLQRRPF